MQKNIWEEEILPFIVHGLGKMKFVDPDAAKASGSENWDP